MTKKENYGLVLAGGGGKGAYEIGVWKALAERKDISIGAVSGTSVGALNAALYASQDYNKAEDIWKNINHQQILSSVKWEREDYLNIISLIPAMTNIPTAAAILMLKPYLNNRLGIFSREGLKTIIETSGIPRELGNGKIPCYATCYNIEEFRTQYFQLNQLNPSEILSVLLASSAIPVIFPVEQVRGTAYVDGGIPLVGDNVPEKPLYDAGFRKFFMVYLAREGTEKKYKDSLYIDIIPSSNQGDMLTGTLDFSPEGSKRRIQQGYEDMKKQLQMLDQSEKKFNEMERIISDISSDSKRFYNGMKDQFSNMNSGISEERACLFADSQADLNRICDAIHHNKEAFNKTLIQFTTNAAAFSSLTDELYKSSFLEKLWNTVTQKDKKLRQDIDIRQIRSQKLLMKAMIQMLENDKSSMALVKSVQNQLQAIIGEVGEQVSRQGQKITDIQSMVSAIKEAVASLEKKYAGLSSEFHELSCTLEQYMINAAGREQNFSERLEDFEDKLEILQWAKTIKIREFAGISYQKLNLCEKIICVVSDFFYITGGNWNDSSLLLVKSVMGDLEIDPNEVIFLADVMGLLVYSQEYQDYLFQRNGIFCHMNIEEHRQMLLYEIFQEGVYIGSRMKECGLKTENGLEAYLQLRGVDEELRLTAFDLVCELLVGMVQLKSEMHVMFP